MTFNFSIVILILSMILAFTAGCNNVKFSDDTSKCTVEAGCLKPGGLVHVQQDLTFTTTNKVDILIVDDNSGSMSTEQANLGSPFNGFISRLQSSGLQWQVAVTNTDVCGGGPCLSPTGITGAQGRFLGPKTATAQPDYGNYILTPSTPGVASVFNNTIQRGNEIGSGDERGIYAANMAIDLRGSSGFFRDASNLAIVFLSDEDERSVGALSPNDPGYLPMESYDQPQTLLNKVVTAFNGQKSLVANSIVIKSGDTGCLSQQSAQGPFYTAHYGTIYEQMSVLAQNGSVVGSICDNGAGSFANMISQITGSIQNLPISNEMTLNYIPSTTPVVTFNPTSGAVAWTWTPGTNVIRFTVRPVSGTTVHAEYDYNPSVQLSLKAQFKMDPQTLKVSLPAGQASTGATDQN